MSLLLQKENRRQEPDPAVQSSGLEGEGYSVPPTLGPWALEEPGWTHHVESEQLLLEDPYRLLG